MPANQVCRFPHIMQAWWPPCKRPPWMWLFNQYPTHLKLLVAPIVKKGHFEPKRSFLCGSGIPQWPPWMCLTIFNHVYTFFNPIRIARMAFGQKVPFGPIKLISGRSGASHWHFWLVQKTQTDPLNVKYNDQPNSTNVQPTWVCLERYLRSHCFERFLEPSGPL